MPRDFRVLTRALVALAGASLLGCPGPAAELVLDLQAADGADLSNVNALRVIVRDLSADAPEVFGPFAIDREARQRLAASVEPGRDFYVDVWGCPRVEDCAPMDMIARGCTPIVKIPEGQSQANTTIVLDDQGLDDDGPCPPTTNEASP